MSRAGILNPRKSGEIIASLSSHVFIHQEGIDNLSKLVLDKIRDESLSVNYFLQSDVHPRPTDEWAVDWIFLVDTLNFCFWMNGEKGRSWHVVHNGETYCGYFALCAAINKAKESGMDITNPAVYSTLSKGDLSKILEGVHGVHVQLLEERAENLKQVGEVLLNKYEGTFKNVIKASNESATKLLSIIVEDFPCFRDEANYKGHKVSFYKRAQILIGDIWTCCQGKGLGNFTDIDVLTMFADYRVPQSLVYHGVISYAEELMSKLKNGIFLENGGEEEVEIRGCSIHAVELLSSKVRELLAKEGNKRHINAVLLDHFLWEFRRQKSKNIEKKGIPHHKTICIYY